MQETLTSPPDSEAKNKTEALQQDMQILAEKLQLTKEEKEEWNTLIKQVLEPVQSTTKEISHPRNSSEYQSERIAQLRQKVDLRTKRAEIIQHLLDLRNQEITVEKKREIITEVLLYSKQKQEFEARILDIKFVHLPALLEPQIQPETTGLIQAEEEITEAEIQQPQTESLPIPDPEFRVTPLDPTLVDQSINIARAFKFPQESHEGWQQFVGILNEPIPSPEESISLQGMSGQKREEQLVFIRKNVDNLLKIRERIIKILPVYVEEAKNNPNGLSDFHRSALIADLINYGTVYSKYIKEFHRRTVNLSQIDIYSTMFLTEIAEEYLEDAAPLSAGRANGYQSLDKLGLPKWLNTDVAKASLEVEKRFANAGVKNVPKLQTILRGSNNIFREMLEGATPESAVTFLIYAYHIHTAEDKMKAALQFANFMVISGMSNAAIGVFERFAQNQALAAWGRNSTLAARRWRMVSRAPGWVKIVAAIGLTIGLDYMIGFDEKLEKLSRNFNAADWEAGGIVVGVMAGDTLIDQASEIGHLTGINTVNPEQELESFLGQRVLTGQQMDSNGQYTGEYHFWLNHVHTLNDWDAQVDVAIKRTTDPALKELWATQYITKGPGGVQGWIERQALKYYTEWGALKHEEQRMDELAAELGILQYITTEELSSEGNVITHNKAPKNYGLHLSLTSGSPDDVYGASGLTNDASYNNLRNRLAELKQRNPEDQRIKTLENMMNSAMNRAKHLATLRGTYVHLDIFSSSWTAERPVTGTSNVILPEIAERGMISQIALNSQRITKLAPNLQTEDITTKMPEFSIMSIPAIVEHVIDYLGREEEVIWTYQRKQDLQHLARMMNSHVPVDKQYEVYGVLQSAIASQSNENLKNPDDVANALANAYLQALVDGNLRKLDQVPQTMNHANDRYDSPDRTIPNLYQFGSIDTEAMQEFITLPDMKVNQLAPEVPQKPEFLTDRAQSIFNEANAYYQKMNALWSKIGTHLQAPIIMSSHDFNGARINCLTLVEYDEEIDQLIVRQKTLTKTLHANGYSNFIGETRMPYEEWKTHHPKFATTIDQDAQAYLKQAKLIHEYASFVPKANELSIEISTSQEISEQEKIKLEAKKNPGSWLYFPTARSVDSQVDDRPSYQYITYLPEEDRFAFLQVARSRRDYGRSGEMRSGTETAQRKRGNEYYPQVTIENEDGSWRRWALRGNYNAAKDEGEKYSRISTYVRTLTIPIPEQNEKTIRNLVRMYMSEPLIDSDHEHRIVDDLLQIYNKLDNSEKQRLFLTHIQEQFHSYTREWQGWPWDRHQNTNMGEGLYLNGYQNSLQQEIKNWAKQKLNVQ